MNKSKFLLSLALLFCGLGSTFANEVSTANKLVDIYFDGTTQRIHDKGTRANANTRVGYSGNANYLENPFDANYPYYGCSAPVATSYFYGTFDKGDELETAFQNSCTWEMLIRLENLNDAGNKGANLKFFSCQQAGGWTFYNNQAGLNFDYLTTDGSTTTTNRVSYSTPIGTLISGKFYHIVATMDKATKKIKLYVNGGSAIEKNRAEGDWAIPNCGTTLKDKNVWFCLGGDPGANAATGSACENSNGTTFVFARIYDGALTPEAVKGLYSDNVKKYTEPKKPANDDLIFDAVFDKDGATNTCGYGSLVPIDELGTVTMGYNTDQQRYEAKFNATNTKYFKFNLAAEPSILDQMADAYSWELYCNVPSTSPGSVRPIGYEMSGYGGAIHLRTASQHLAWQTFTYGYDASSAYTLPGWRWTYSELPTTYTHYVVVYDRKGQKAFLYENGNLADTRNMTLKECEAFYWAPSAWVGIGGNASNWYKVNAACGNPHNGNISIARFWGKALSASDVRGLYASAINPVTSITIDETGYKAVCLPKNYTLPEGLTAYIIKQQNEKTASLETLATAGQNIKYATPVILAGKPGAYNINAVNISGTVEFANAEGNLLEGSYASKNVKKDEFYALKAGKKGKPILVKTDDETLDFGSAWLPISIATTDSVKLLVLGNDTIKDEKASSTTPNPQPQKPDANKKDPYTFAVMGNSISTYENYLPTGYAVYYATSRGFTAGVQVGDTYWMRLSRLTGMTYLTNASWSGSRVCSDADQSAIAAFTSDDRINAVGRAGVPDFILIAGGTNDWSGGRIPLGEYSETVFNDSLTFRGAYTMLLHKLKKRYPNIIPLCCSLFPRSQTLDTANKAGWTIRETNESIKQIAKQFGAIYVDCSAVPFSDDWTANTIDKLHPTAKGHAMLAECIAKSLLDQGVISDTLKKTSEVAEADKLLDISFNKDGIVNNGSYQTKVGSNGNATTIYDKENNVYYGCTKNGNSDYFYANYDAESKLGDAMNNSVTWETLVRLENLYDPTNGGGGVKFFSSQEDGGWAFTNSGKNVLFNYLTEGGTYSNMKYEINDSTLIAGKFYHLVVTLDRTSHIMRYFVNGKLVATGTRVGNDLRFPDCGINRQKNLWIGLGCDPGVASAGSVAQNSAASTFVFARIYDGALTEKAASALYNEEVKKFTEPEIAFDKDLIMNAVFGKDGVTNAVTNGAEIEEVGKVKTAYNEATKSYEAQFDGSKNNFYKFNLGNSVAIMNQMADEYSVEVCCQTESANPSASVRPVSIVDTYGFALHMNGKGNIAFGTLTFGHNANSTYTKAPWVWTGEGTLTGDYTHYVLSYNRKNGTSKLYINGVEKGSRNLYFKESNYMEWAPSNWLAIGGDPVSAPYDNASQLAKYMFRGNINLVRLWSKSLNAEEATGLYKAAVDGISYTLNSTGYAAVCLPYATKLPEGVTAYIVTDEDASNITIKAVANADDVIPFGTPIIIKGEAKATVTLYPTDAEAQSTIDLTGNKLQGTYAQTTIGMNTYYVGTGSNGMMKVSNTRNLNSFASWLPSAGFSKTLRTFTVLTPTGIKGINANDDADAYFDLEGRKVEKPTRGLYIKNGQKIFVK